MVRRIPLERAADPIGDVADVADDGGIAADFDRTDGRTPRADGLDPVLVMALRIQKFPG